MKNHFIVFMIFILGLDFVTNGQGIIVDLSEKHQTIEGFGGFGPKKVWWDSGPYYDKAFLDQVIDSLGCKFIRTQIYWNSEPVNDDANPNHFNWNAFKFNDPTDDNGKQLDFIRDASNKNARIIATVWTPPIWMKGLETYYGTYNGSALQRRPSAADLNSNCAWCGGANGCTQVGGRLIPEFYAEFAEYLAAYVITVKNETGADIYAINIQNEPMFANPFESCVVPPSEYAEILKAVGARFEKEGLKTKLYGPEHMGEWTWGMNKEYVKEVLEDTSVSKYLAFYSVHSYVDGVAADYGSAAGWTNLQNAITKTHGKALWMTETSDFNLTGFNLGFEMAKGLYLALKFGEISGWVYWYMADAMIQNNKLTKLGYSFKNFYKFVKPGMVQVGCTSSDKSILSIAFSQDTITTVILINDSQTEKSSSLTFTGPNGMSLISAYRTSSTENCLCIEGLQTGQLLLSAESITTLNFSHVTGITKKISEKNSIYPNPTNGELHFSSLSSNYFLTDMSGRKLRTGKIENNMLDFTGIHQGLYFLTIQTTDGWDTRKLIIDN